MSVFPGIALIAFTGAVTALIVHFERSTSVKDADDPEEAARRRKVARTAYEYRVYRDLVWRGTPREEARRIARERAEAEYPDPE
ncbi:MAG: hypothetical protein IJH91_09435 [Mogibacterium sp.]|nr:hypothetical protein [Mogibacterium sp.]